MFESWNWASGIVGIIASAAIVWPFGLWILRRLDEITNLSYVLLIPVTLVIGALAGFFLVCASYILIEYIGESFADGSAFIGVLVLLGGVILAGGFFLSFTCLNQRRA